MWRAAAPQPVPRHAARRRGCRRPICPTSSQTWIIRTSCSATMHNILSSSIFGFMAPRAMTEPAFFILTALVDAPRHGYGIVGEVAELSAGRVALKIGTLYGVLDRLVGDGLVELDREEVQQGRLRRDYKLTHARPHAPHAQTRPQGPQRP